MRRWSTLALAALLVNSLLANTPIANSRAHAAPIRLTNPGGGHVRIDPVFTDVAVPRNYSVRGVGEPLFTDLQTTNANPAPDPPAWTMQTFWVSAPDAIFDYRPTDIASRAVVDLTEFILAGDAQLTLQINGAHTGADPWNSVTWISPALGQVTRTYSVIPEPTAACLAIAATLLALSRRRA